jgi:hypothetical protein
MLKLIFFQIMLIALTFSQSAHAFRPYEFVPTHEHDIIATGTETHALVFLNLNASLREQAAAQAEAQRMGLAFAMVPSLKAINELGKIVDHAADLNETEKREGFIVAHNHDFNSNVEFRSLVDELDSRNLKVSHLIISGHNSDGGFSGDFFSLKVFAHRKVRAVMSDYPEAFSELRFMALWGCASVTEETIAYYHSKLPSLKMMAGYYDTAPKGIRPKSAGYLRGVMNASEALISTTSRNALEKRIKAIPFINEVFAGIWVEPAPEHSYFYYQSETDHAYFDEYGSHGHCDRFRKSFFDQDVKTVDQYFFASPFNRTDQFHVPHHYQIEIPEDTSHSPLRDAYYNLLQNYACYKDDAVVKYTPQKAGSLRFFTGVQFNFTRTFADVIQRAQVEFNLLPDSVRAMPAMDLADVLTKQSRPQLIDLSKNLQRLKLTAPMHSALTELSLLVDRYLYNVDDVCMDMLEWHDAHEDLKFSDPATPYCRLNEVDRTPENPDGFAWAVTPQADD